MCVAPGTCLLPRAFYTSLYDALLSVPMRGVVSEEQQQQLQQKDKTGKAHKKQGGAAGGNGDDTIEAADPPGTAALAAAATVGRVVAGAASGAPTLSSIISVSGHDRSEVEEPLPVLLGTALGQVRPRLGLRGSDRLALPALLRMPLFWEVKP